MICIVGFGVDADGESGLLATTTWVAKAAINHPVPIGRIGLLQCRCPSMTFAGA